MPYGQLQSFALAGGFLRVGVSKNQWWLWHLIKTTLKMSEISNKGSLNNGVEAAEKKGEGFLHSICPLGHHSATARRKCSKEDNKMAIL